MAQKCGNCHRNWMANNAQPSFTDSLSAPAAHPISGGKAPGTAPTSTASEFHFSRACIRNSYSTRKRGSHLRLAELKPKTEDQRVPATPVTAEATIGFRCRTGARPATAVAAVRAISLSVSFSSIWLMVLAEPETRMPPANNKRTFNKVKFHARYQQIGHHTGEHHHEW